MQPYFDTTHVRLVVRDGEFVGSGEVVYEKTVELDLSGRISTDEAYAMALDFVSEHLDPDAPYTIGVSASRFSQGADGQVLDIALSTIESLRGVAWEALALLLAEYVAQRLRADDDEDNKR